MEAKKLPRLSGSVGICSKAGINFSAQAVRRLMNLRHKKMHLRENLTFRTFLTSDIISKKIEKFIWNIIFHILKNSLNINFNEKKKFSIFRTSRR